MPQQLTGLLKLIDFSEVYYSCRQALTLIVFVWGGGDAQDIEEDKNHSRISNLWELLFSHNIWQMFKSFGNDKCANVKCENAQIFVIFFRHGARFGWRSVQVQS